MGLKSEVIKRLDNAILDYIKNHVTENMDRFMYRLEVYSSFRNEIDKTDYLQPHLNALHNCTNLLFAIRTSVSRNTNGVIDPPYDELVSNFVDELYQDERQGLLISRVEDERQDFMNDVLKKPNAQVLDEVYHISMLDDLVSFLRNRCLRGREIDALLTYPNILGAIYDEWISGSYINPDELKDCIVKCAELRENDLLGELPEGSYNEEALAIWNQMYDGNEMRAPDYDGEYEDDEELEP